ncbi:PTPDL family protein [Haloferula sargassicola]|uniref:Uncharacterized protein n=1 Tax=Haloferula sargassicola TaxID=490096 RepID=A0ABP9UTB0_9BACT
MNPKKAAIFLAPLLLGAVSADTIRLKDGTKIEGTIISETDDSYVALVQVTPSIRDQRTIAKSDVVAVVAESKDEKEFPEIKELVPTPDMLSVDDYEKRIKKVQKFLSAYPDTSYKSAAKKIEATLQEELKAIQKGGTKVDGKIVAADDREARAYGFDAQVQFEKFKDLVDEDQYILALRQWDKLAADFPTTQAYKDSVPVVSKLIKDVHTMLGKQVRSFDERKIKRNEDFKRMPTEEKPRTKKAIEDEMARYESQLEQEKKAGERWISVNIWHIEGMRELRGTLAKQYQELKDLDVSAIPDGDKAYAEAWKTLKGEPEPEDAAAALKAAKDAGVTEPYMKKLEEIAPEGVTAGSDS